MATRQLKQAGLLGTVLSLAVALAGCTPPAPQPPVSVTPTASATPAQPFTPTPTPLPTASGASGPLGVVQVNQTFSGATGLVYTVQEVTTVWLDAEQFRWVGAGSKRAVGVRLSVDDRAVKADGTKLDDWPPPGDMPPVFLTTLDGAHYAYCYHLNAGGQADTAHNLSLLGGDVAYSFDEEAGLGEGWVVCDTSPADDDLFGGEYIVNIRSRAGNAFDGTPVFDPVFQVVIVP